MTDSHTEHVVTVRAIPDDLTVPQELQRKFRVDHARRQLAFRGFMYKADYDGLVRLSADLEYLRGVERLFQISTRPAAPARRRGVGWWIAAACLTLALATLAARSGRTPDDASPTPATASPTSVGSLAK